MHLEWVTISDTYKDDTTIGTRIWRRGGALNSYMNAKGTILRHCTFTNNRSLTVGGAVDVRDQGVMAVAPGVLGRERVIGQHHARVEAAREPRGVPHVELVDRPHEAAAVAVIDGAGGRGAAPGQRVRRPAAEVLGDHREVPVEAAHGPRRQRSVQPGVPDLDPGPLALAVVDLAGLAQSGHGGGQGAVTEARAHWTTVGDQQTGEHAASRAESAEKPQTLRTCSG